jgi:hypothetical protein
MGAPAVHTIARAAAFRAMQCERVSAHPSEGEPLPCRHSADMRRRWPYLRAPARSVPPIGNPAPLRDTGRRARESRRKNAISFQICYAPRQVRTDFPDRRGPFARAAPRGEQAVQRTAEPTTDSHPQPLHMHASDATRHADCDTHGRATHRDRLRCIRAETRAGVSLRVSPPESARRALRKVRPFVITVLASTRGAAQVSVYR